MRLFLLWLVGLGVFRNCAAYDTEFHKYETFLKHTRFCTDKMVRKYYDTKALCHLCTTEHASNINCQRTFYGPYSVMMHDTYNVNDCNSPYPSIRRSQSSFNIDLTNASVYKFISIESPRIGTTTCHQLLSGGLTIHQSSVRFFEHESEILHTNGLTSRAFDRCEEIRVVSPHKMIIAHEINASKDTNWCEDDSKNMPLTADDQKALEYHLCSFSSQRLVRRDFSTVELCNTCANALDQGGVSPSCYETVNESGFRFVEAYSTFTDPYVNECASADTPFIIVPDWRLGLNLASSRTFPYMLKRCALGTDWLGNPGPIFLHESQNVTSDFSNTEYRHCGHDNLTLIDLSDIYNGNLICSHADGSPGSGIVTTTTPAETTTTNTTAEESLDTGQLAAGFIVAIALGLGVGALVIWEAVRRVGYTYTSLRSVQSKAAWRIA